MYEGGIVVARREGRSLHTRTPRLLKMLVFASVGVFGACASGPTELPNPRRIVIHSGARLSPTKERMTEVHQWVTAEADSISVDPSFLITTTAEAGPVYPWAGLETNEAGDTAEIRVQGRAFEARLPYNIYAHLHLMAIQERLDVWLPEAVGAEGFELERAILARVAESWLYGRSIFDATPYGILDELMYAKENGYLDAYILTARPDSFVEARRQWLDESPGADEEYREWFLRTFSREPPGIRGAT